MIHKRILVGLLVFAIVGLGFGGAGIGCACCGGAGEAGVGSCAGGAASAQQAVLPPCCASAGSDDAAGNAVGTGCGDIPVAGVVQHPDHEAQVPLKAAAKSRMCAAGGDSHQAATSDCCAAHWSESVPFGPVLSAGSQAGCPCSVSADACGPGDIPEIATIRTLSSGPVVHAGPAALPPSFVDVPYSVGTSRLDTVPVRGPGVALFLQTSVLRL